MKKTQPKTGALCRIESFRSLAYRYAVHSIRKRHNPEIRGHRAHVCLNSRFFVCPVQLNESTCGMQMGIVIGSGVLKPRENPIARKKFAANAQWVHTANYTEQSKYYFRWRCDLWASRPCVKKQPPQCNI